MVKVFGCASELFDERQDPPGIRVIESIDKEKFISRIDEIRMHVRALSLP